MNISKSIALNSHSSIKKCHKAIHTHTHTLFSVAQRGGNAPKIVKMENRKIVENKRGVDEREKKHEN